MPCVSSSSAVQEMRANADDDDVILSRNNNKKTITNDHSTWIVKSFHWSRRSWDSTEVTLAFRSTVEWRLPTTTTAVTVLYGGWCKSPRAIASASGEHLNHGWWLVRDEGIVWVWRKVKVSPLWFIFFVATRHVQRQTDGQTNRRFRDFTERERWVVTGGVKVPEWTSGWRWWSWSVTRGGDFFLGNIWFCNGVQRERKTNR